VTALFDFHLSKQFASLDGFNYDSQKSIHKLSVLTMLSLPAIRTVKLQIDSSSQ